MNIPCTSLCAILLAAATAAAQEWAPAAKDAIPPNAFRAGNEPEGGALYVIRAQHNNLWVPGKYTAPFRKGIIPYDGKEVEVRQFEVYVGDGQWVRPQGFLIPGGAVKAGRDVDGRPLYVCRSAYKGGLHPGKVDDQGNAFIPHGDREIRVTDYEVLVPRVRPEYLNTYRWTELHPPGTVFMDMSYPVVGAEGRLNLFAVDVANGTLVHEVVDNASKGVKHSDLSNGGLAEFFNGMLSRKHPKLRVREVRKNESQTWSWNTRYFSWGSYRWGQNERVTRVYPRGGVIDYRPKTATFEFTARNIEDTYLPDDLGTHYRLLTLANGALPRVTLMADKATTLRLVYQRPTGKPLPYPMVAKLQVFDSTPPVNGVVAYSAVEPALAVGADGTYQVEFLIPGSARAGEFPYSLSVGYLSQDQFRSANEDEIVRELSFESQIGSYRLVLREDPQGTALAALRAKLNEQNRFLSMRPGKQIFEGKQIYVVSAHAISGTFAPPAGVDGVLVRCRTREEIQAANARLALPPDWATKLENVSESIAGHAELFTEAYSYVSTFTTAYMDSATKRARDLAKLGEDQDVLMVLKAPDGRTIYKMDDLWVSESRLPDGTRVMQKGTDSIPTGSRELAASRFSRATDAAGKAMGGLALGMTLYQTGNDVVHAWRQGDEVKVTLLTAQGTIKIATQVVSMTKWAKSAGGTALAYADAAMGLFEVGKAVYDFRKASGSIDRMQKGEAIAGASLNTGMAVLTVAYPPAAVIDPTFKATVMVLNKWIPGSKSNKDLTAAALADIGTALTFMGSYLTTGINAETARQGLTIGIEEVRKAFPNYVFIPPK